MSSFTLTLNGNSSELIANYYPPIELDRDGEYVCGLIDFHTFMSIPNVNEKNNRFYYINLADRSRNKSARKDNTRDRPRSTVGGYYDEIIIPTGSYELVDLVKYLSDTLAKKEPGVTIYIGVNKNTLKCELKCNRQIFFDAGENTLGSLLGFEDGVLEADVQHISTNVIKINSTNVIKFETNITTGAYSNNKLMRTLHEFYPSVDVGYKIVEVPRHVIYLPVAARSIHNLIVRIVDQDNNLIDFRGESITLRVHIKRL